MNTESLCMGCMEPRGSAMVCPECGWREGTLPDSTLQLPARTVLHDVYLLGKALGQGGFGVVYLAWDTEHEDKRAVKEYLPTSLAIRARDGRTVRPSTNQNREPFSYGLEKFVQEAGALKRFAGHPNIVGVLDFFEGNGTAYIVMKYVEGLTLKQYLDDKGGKVPFETALKILIPVMDALREVHAAGILHRDISPDNIYLCYSGPVKLLDFGATKQAIGEQSKSVAAIFKPGYTPLEQYLSDGNQGPWTDVYALGATFYRSVTGETAPLAWDRREKDDLKPPSRLGVNIPRQAEAALMQALAVRPEHRFRSVAAFQSVLLQKDQPSDSKSRPREPLHPAAARLSKTFYLGAYAIGWGLFDVLAIASQIQRWTGRGNSPGEMVAGQLAALVFNIIVMLALVLRMWRPIQDGRTRRSPEQAVAIMFVPFYGVFQGLWGFAKEYNAYVSRHSSRVSKLPEGLFLTYAILSCVLWVPVLAIPCMVAHYFMGTVMVSYICDAVNGLRESPPDRQAARMLQLYCLSGEFQGNDVEIPAEGLIIGRNRNRANLVLTSDLVSGAHVRVWLDPAGSGLWIEDLNSTNGTCYLEAQAGKGRGEWIQLRGRKLLTAGERFQLGDEAAEFEVRNA
jgi:serine/threonine protein kinase